MCPVRVADAADAERVIQLAPNIMDGYYHKVRPCTRALDASYLTYPPQA